MSLCSKLFLLHEGRLTQVPRLLWTFWMSKTASLQLLKVMFPVGIRTFELRVMALFLFWVWACILLWLSWCFLWRALPRVFEIISIYCAFLLCIPISRVKTSLSFFCVEPPSSVQGTGNTHSRCAGQLFQCSGLVIWVSWFSSPQRQVMRKSNLGFDQGICYDSVASSPASKMHLRFIYLFLVVFVLFIAI